MRATVIGAAMTVAAIAAIAATVGCKVKDPPPIEGVWTDDFERGSIGGNYYKTGGGYRIHDGTLSAKGGADGSYNHPLWLRKKLPTDVMIELETWSNTPDGDIKVELFGDGMSHAQNKGQYTSSGYVFVMGGWDNSKSVLARGNEHGKDIKQRTSPKVEVGKHYKWKIVRSGTKLDWYVDDMDRAFLSFEDKTPLEGVGHEYFGFNNWESDSHFDNLVVTPL